MSYILEALKKAQAERQLGNAPTLNAVPVGAPPPAATRASALPLIAIGAGVAAALVVGGVLWWMKAPAPAVLLTAPVAVAPPVVVAPPVIVPAPVAVTPALAVAPASKPVAAVVAPVPAPARAPAPVTVKAAAPPEEERLPSLRELPDNLRASIPPVTFGGYMYSNNPADRLLLIDKVLRHEGEEVAPGLVLEKLLPKAALMNYRGTRYKVAY